MTVVVIGALGMIGMILAYAAGKAKAVALHQAFLANAYASLVRRIEQGDDPQTVLLDEFNPARLGAWTYKDAKAVVEAERGE